MGRTTRVVIADDHEAIRTALRDLFDLLPGIEVVGEATDGWEAVALAEALRPHVVIMDLRMPGLDGIEATRLIKESHPQIRVVGHSAYASPDLTRAMEEAGADGFAVKGALDLAALERLVTAA